MSAAIALVKPSPDNRWMRTPADKDSRLGNDRASVTLTPMGTRDVPAVRIRRATAQDAQQVFPLARDMATSFKVAPAAFLSSFAHVMAQDEAVVLVADEPTANEPTANEPTANEPTANEPTADEPTAIVGYLLGFDHRAFYANGRVAYVEELAVTAHRQGEGIGHLLKGAFEEWASSRSAVLVTVATRRAGAFYLSAGYEETAVLFRKLL